MMHILFSWGGFEVHTAPAMAGVSVLIAFLYFRTRSAAAGLSEEDLWTLLSAMALGVMGGAVLFYAVAYSGGAVESLKTLFVRRQVPGGSFWGSFWVTMLLAWAYCRARKLAGPPVYDLIALSAMLALAVMRLGCLANGCCYGMPTGLPWGVTFTDPRCSVPSALLGVALHPVQLYEAAGCLSVFLAGHFVLLRRARLPHGGVFVFCVVCYSALRFALDFVRAGGAGLFDGLGLTTAQFIAIFSAAGSLIWYRMKKKA
ncbi:MAG: prolipoprotein diacylglyceryl transferase family protein [Elusimicrobiota bacterium]